MRRFAASMSVGVTPVPGDSTAARSGVSSSTTQVSSRKRRTSGSCESSSSADRYWEMTWEVPAKRRRKAFGSSLSRMAMAASWTPATQPSVRSWSSSRSSRSTSTASARDQPRGLVVREAEVGVADLAEPAGQAEPLEPDGWLRAGADGEAQRREAAGGEEAEVVVDRGGDELVVVDDHVDVVVEVGTGAEERLERVGVDRTVERQQVVGLLGEARDHATQPLDDPLPEADRVAVGGVGVEPDGSAGGLGARPLGEQARLARAGRAHDHAQRRPGPGVEPGEQLPARHEPRCRGGRGELGGGEARRPASGVTARWLRLDLHVGRVLPRVTGATGFPSGTLRPVRAGTLPITPLR